MKESCPFCAGIDKDGTPTNCLICRTNPKYLDKKKERLSQSKDRE